MVIKRRIVETTPTRRDVDSIAVQAHSLIWSGPVQEGATTG
jgi:hypothetical protein